MPATRPKKSIFSTRPYLRKLNARKLRKTWNERKFLSSRAYSTNSARPTASNENISVFGKLFIASFSRQVVGKRTTAVMEVSRSQYESPVSLSLRFGKGETDCFEARLGFDENAVYIEALQGPKNALFNASLLHEELKAPWPDFLIKQIEKHARGTGFRYVRIHEPSTSRYFYNLTETLPLSGEEIQKIQRRIDSLRKKEAQGSPLELSDGEITVLASLKQEKIILKGRKLFFSSHLHASEKREFWERYKKFIESHASAVKSRKRIQSFIHLVAKNNGYKKKGAFFEKKLRSVSDKK